MKVLLELRPAFDGHSGIPQETRLLFRGLAALDGVDVVGLIQSSNLAIEGGLPMRGDEVAPGVSDAEAIDRVSKVIVSLQQGRSSNRAEHLRRRLRRMLGPPLAVITSTFGRDVRLGGFDPARFKDFVWRALFAKSLPEGDFDLVTSRAFRVLRWPWSMLHVMGVLTSWFGRALYPRLATEGIDVFIVETPYPARVRRPTRMVVRYHDAIPLLMPHTIKDRGYHRAAHYQALVRNAKDGAWFACVSEATRRDLISVLPELASRAVTIPNMVSHHFHPETGSSARVPEVIWSRKNRFAPHGGGAPLSTADLNKDGAFDYLLMVGTIEPRKNHVALLDAWEVLRAESFPTLQLVFVGSLGWEHDLIVQRLAPWLERGGLHLLEGVPANDLRLLYRHARVTVCPSFGEGFDFPGVEAMRSGGVVAASDIPVHRDVLGDACAYFDAYGASDQARCIAALIGPGSEARRDELIGRGAAMVEQYLPERVMAQWQAFLQQVAGGASTAVPGRRDDSAAPVAAAR